MQLPRVDARDSLGGRPRVDHLLTIEAAKLIAITSRTRLGLEAGRGLVRSERAIREHERSAVADLLALREQELAVAELGIATRDARALLADMRARFQESHCVPASSRTSRRPSGRSRTRTRLLLPIPAARTALRRRRGRPTRFRPGAAGGRPSTGWGRTGAAARTSSRPWRRSAPPSSAPGRSVSGGRAENGTPPPSSKARPPLRDARGVTAEMRKRAVMAFDELRRERVVARDKAIAERTAVDPERQDARGRFVGRRRDEILH